VTGIVRTRHTYPSTVGMPLPQTILASSRKLGTKSVRSDGDDEPDVEDGDNRSINGIRRKFGDPSMRLDNFKEVKHNEGAERTQATTSSEGWRRSRSSE
jgi:hypothetical protein